MFFKGSRYEKVPTITLVSPTGRTIAFKSTRFIPPTPGVEGHWVTASERLDQIAWDHYRNPERFWRICDANSATWPDEILVEGTVINVATSEG